MTTEADIQAAWTILRSDGGDPKELFAMAKRLKGANQFRLARRILERASQQQLDSRDFSLLIRQQRALCTYKDPDVPKHVALERALEILDHEGELGSTVDQETLGIAGAIYKRRWQVDARKAHLERSLAYYYERGHKEAAKIRAMLIPGIAKSQLDGLEEHNLDRILEGYTSINAAFVLDLLASIEEREAKDVGARRRSRPSAARWRPRCATSSCRAWRH